MKKNKMFAFGFVKCLFALCFMLSFIIFNDIDASAEEAEIDTSVFEYRRNLHFDYWDDTLIITKYNGFDETVVVPSKIDGKSVTSIDSSAFYGCETIKHLTIQEGIKEINNSTFAMCKNLEEVIIPEGMTHIGIGAFSGCESIINIDIPDSVDTIETDAFAGCIKLSNIKLPNGINIIASGSFLNCRSLQNIMLPNSVKTIGSYAFAGCDSLTKIIIPNSVNRMDDNIFVDCNDNAISNNIALKNVVIYAAPSSYARTYANQNGIKFSCLNFHDWDNGTITIEPTIQKKGEQIFSCTACGIKKTEELPIALMPQKGKNISVFNSHHIYKVTKSGKKNGTVEFKKTNNTGNASISIPNAVTIGGITYKVTSIAKNAFINNRNLKKVTIGKNITKINAGAFNGCKNLNVISIKSKKISSVGKNAFKGIKAKAKIKVPSSRLSKYKKIFADKGQKSTVKITK